jgi:ABC-2 type transport system permease protein
MTAATTATTTALSARAPSGTRSGPTFARVVAAEWTKLTSLRSPWWVAGVTAAVAFAITYLSAGASSVDPGFEPLGSLTSGLLLAQVGPLVLGVLIGAGEFRSGAFRTTFTTVPRRWLVLAAQTLVVTAFALGTGVLAAVACVVGILPAASSRGITVDLTTGDAPGVLLSMVLFIVGLALLGFALGSLLRRTVPAMVTTLGVVLILPIVLVLGADLASGPPDPASYDTSAEAAAQITVLDTALAFSPGGAAQLMTVPASAGPMEGTPDLGPVARGLVLAAWILALLVTAAIRLRARDAR